MCDILSSLLKILITFVFSFFSRIVFLSRFFPDFLSKEETRLTVNRDMLNLLVSPASHVISIEVKAIGEEEEVVR